MSLSGSGEWPEKVAERSNADFLGCRARPTGQSRAPGPRRPSTHGSGMDVDLFRHAAGQGGRTHELARRDRPTQHHCGSRGWDAPCCHRAPKLNLPRRDRCPTSRCSGGEALPSLLAAESRFDIRGYDYNQSMPGRRGGSPAPLPDSVPSDRLVSLPLCQDSCRVNCPAELRWGRGRTPRCRIRMVSNQE